MTAHEVPELFLTVTFSFRLYQIMKIKSGKCHLSLLSPTSITKSFHENFSKISQTAWGQPYSLPSVEILLIKVCWWHWVWLILLTKDSPRDFLDRWPTIDSHQDVITFSPLHVTQELWGNLCPSLFLTSKQVAPACKVTHKVTPTSFSVSTHPEQVILFILMFLVRRIIPPGLY